MNKASPLAAPCIALELKECHPLNTSVLTVFANRDAVHVQSSSLSMLQWALRVLDNEELANHHDANTTLH